MIRGYHHFPLVGLLITLSFVTPGPAMTGAQTPDAGRAEPPSQAEPAPAQLPYDQILEFAPSDAWLVAYTPNLEKLVEHPLLVSREGSDGKLAALGKALADTFGGPGLVAIRGVPLELATWDVMLAARAAIEPPEFFARFATAVVPAWNRSALGEFLGPLHFNIEGSIGRLVVAGPVPISMTLAVRDGMVLGLSAPYTDEDWTRLTDPDDSLVDSERLHQRTGGWSGPIGGLLYIDIRSLVPLAGPLLNQALPNLFGALQVDRVESIMLISSAPTSSGPLRLALGVSDSGDGPWHLLASTPTAPGLARAFPPDTNLFLQGSMERATDLVDDVVAFAGAIDREIVEEYEQERAEFKREVGFDPHAEFLANFVGGWAFGAIIRPDEGLESPLLAIRLEQADRFAAHMQRLGIVYRLETRSSVHRGVTIERAARKGGPFSYAVVRSMLLISPDHGRIVDAVDAILDGKGLDRSERFAAARKQAAPKTSKILYFDVARMFADALEFRDEDDVPEEVLSITKTGTAVGLSILPHENVIAVDLVVSSGSIGQVLTLLWRSLDASLEWARFLSARLVSTSNVKSLLIGCFEYSTRHKDRWPDSLDVLVASDVLGDREAAARLLADPYKRADQRGRQPYYLYRPVRDPRLVKVRASTVVIGEPEIHHGGAVFGFLDGHVEWVAFPRAEELLATLRAEP